MVAAFHTLFTYWVIIVVCWELILLICFLLLLHCALLIKQMMLILASEFYSVHDFSLC